MMKTLVNYLVNAYESFPQNRAIEIDDHAISYHELYVNSCKIAAWLSKLDSSSNILICLPKSFHLYYSIFAVLLSGNCYVPVNYLSPESRLKYILADSKSSFIISTVKILASFFPELKNSQLKSNSTAIAMVNENRIDAVFAIEEILNNPFFPHYHYQVSENTSCYLLYTSGSTGKPKGILHTHESACAFVDWASHHLMLTSTDVIAHKSSVCFDLSVFDIFATVKVAAMLVPVPDHFFNNGTLLINYVSRKKITIFYSVPSTLLGYLTDSNLQRIKDSSLRHIIFAGEQLYTQHLTKLYDNLPIHCQLHNWYGPTETNVCSFFRITKKSILSNQIIPIGSSCDFTELSIDENSVLLIKSKGMMKCYWDKLRVTDTYYTGDIVRQDNEGQYFFDGRIDRQIKFQGYRIQLEEIESVINVFLGINESAAVINKEIMVFISVNNAFSNNAELLSFCRKHLEHYMLPTQIILVNEIFRTQRGKIDYTKLLALVRE